MKNRGFTVIELVIIIVLLGVLAATTLPRYMDSSNDARRAVNNGTVAALNTSMAAVLARARVPGALQLNLPAFASPGTYSKYRQVYLVNVDNNPNTQNNFISFFYSTDYPATTINRIVLAPIGAGTAISAYSASTAPSLSIYAYGDLYGGSGGASPPVSGCTYFFNILMGNESVQTGSATTTYNTVSSSSAISISVVNGLTTGNSGTFKNSTPVPLTTSFATPFTSITPAAIPGGGPPTTSGACVYQMNNTANINFYIIYDPVQVMFYSGET